MGMMENEIETTSAPRAQGVEAHGDCSHGQADCFRIQWFSS